MKLGDLFEKEWECDYSTVDPCWATDPLMETKPILHERCGWRYVASLNEYDYEKMKDIKIL